MCAALPVYTGEIVVSGVSGGSAGDVASVIWFGDLTSKGFRLDFVVFNCGNCFF